MRLATALLALVAAALAACAGPDHEHDHAADQTRFGVSIHADDRLAGFAADSDDSVVWEAERQGGVVIATFTGDPAGPDWMVTMTPDGAASIAVGDLVLDGHGPLGPTAAATLAALAAGPVARRLARVGLELGCVSGDGDGDGDLVAALLAPWQVLLKYAGGPTLADVAPEVACTPTAIGDDGDDGARAVVYVADFPMPYASDGPFPLDGDGFVGALADGATARAAGVYRGACGALCRGACGPDCAPRACTVGACVDGNQDVTCGSHAGCRAHDACYDACKLAANCRWTAASFACHRACDTTCISTYGVRQCNAWRRGRGPFDQQITYTRACPAAPIAATPSDQVAL